MRGVRKMRIARDGLVIAFVFALLAVMCVSGVRAQSTHPYLNMPYSVDPSFSVSIPYDLSLYGSMPGYLSRFERCEADVRCILESVYGIEQERPDLNWVVSYGGNIVSSMGGIAIFPEDYIWASYCEEPDQRAVNSIAEAIDMCAHAPDKECVCPYRTAVLPETEESGDIDEDLAAFESLFGIDRFTYDFWDDEDRMFNTISFDRERDDLRVSLEGSSAGSLVKDVSFDGVHRDLPGSPAGLKYSRRGVGDRLFIYKDAYGKISVLPDKPDDDSRQCRVQDRILKFCVVQNSSFFAYDDEKKRMGVQQLVLKFAYLFRGEISDVSDFEVRDARLASGTLLLVWDPLLGVDVDHYTLYYSGEPGMKANLEGVSPEELDPAVRDRLDTLELPVEGKQDIHISVDSLLSPECVIDRLNCTKRYSLLSVLGIDVVSADVEDSTLYYSTADERFFYFLPGVGDGQLYTFAITATDSSGKESPSFNFPDPASQEVSEDDLPPGLADVVGVSRRGDQVLFTIRNISYSIDGTPMDPDDIVDYRIYCFSHDLSGSFDLSETPSVFAENIRELDDGTVQFTKYLSDFNSFNCGFFVPPYVARFVVAGVERTSAGQDISYQGNVSERAFSGLTVEVPAGLIGEESME